MSLFAIFPLTGAVQQSRLITLGNVHGLKRLNRISSIKVPQGSWVNHYSTKANLSPGQCVVNRSREFSRLIKNREVELLLHRHSTIILVRPIHASNSLLGSGEETPQAPSSKVEETVKVLEKQLEKSKQGTVEPAVKRSLYKRVQDEVLHYYHGFRLLFIDIKISGLLMWRILNGKQLSRREHKQLIRTTSDLFRLVPFSVFIIIPFMELLLPFFIKLFPGMLPSTFQTSKDRESKMKGELKVKLEMAKFLQQTLDQMAPQAKGRSSQEAKDFAEFIEKIRKSGSEATTEDILRYSKLFEDEITLDSLSRAQLLALCRVLEIPAIGTTTMLRFQLRLRLRQLKSDDLVIEREGIETLDLQELQTACKARGMIAIGVSENRLRRQLAQWLTLSLHEKVPQSLLLLTRAMYLPEHLPATQQLQATLQALPDSATLSTKAAIGEREGKIDNKTRIELIREEERKIKEERQEASKDALLQKERETARKELLGAKIIENLGGREYVPAKEIAGVIEPDTPAAPQASEHSVAAIVNAVLLRKLPLAPANDDKITSADFETIEGVIERLGQDTKLIIEREELKDLKEEITDYIEDISNLEDITKQAHNLRIRESVGARRLLKKLSTMVTKLETTITTNHSEDQKEGSEDLKTIQRSLVATEELVSAIRRLKDVKDPAKLERVAAVLAKLDDDSDGKIEVDDLVKVIDVVGREHVDLSSKQLEEIVKMLTKEPQ